MLLDKYQTPSKQHFDNWLVVVMFWILFTCREEVNYTPNKWRQYKEAQSINKQQQSKESTVLTPNQVRQVAQALFLTFDSTSFHLKTSNKGKGRSKNTKIKQRSRFPVVKKSYDKNKIKVKIE